MSRPSDAASRDTLVAALEQAVEALDLATSALAETKTVKRAVLTAKLATAAHELHALVGVAIGIRDRESRDRQR